MSDSQSDSGKTEDIQGNKGLKRDRQSRWANGHDRHGLLRRAGVKLLLGTSLDYRDWPVVWFFHR